jgi:hypothetical protein
MWRLFQRAYRPRELSDPISSIRDLPVGALAN